MSLRRLSGRISSGASAPKPATEPRGLGKKLIFSEFTLRRLENSEGSKIAAGGKGNDARKWF